MSATGPPLPVDAACIAVVCPSWVGDTVMATPALRAVRRERPGARLIAVLRRGLAPLLDGLPDADELIEGPFKGTGGLSTARRMRAAGPDAVLLLPNSFRAGVLARLSGAPVRVGYRRDLRGPLLTRAVPVPRDATPIPTVRYYTDLAAAALGAPVDDRGLALAVTDDQAAAGSRILPEGDPFALLNPGGNKKEKRWPLERFAAVADALRERRGLRTVVTGAPAERDLVRGVLDALEPGARGEAIDLVARGIDLGSLKAVVRRAAVMITNDTGPRHIAAALGTPLVSLFGPTDPRWTTLEGVRERTVRAEPFLPVELVCDDHPRACRIERIAVGDVLFAAEGLLGPGGA